MLNNTPCTLFNCSKVDGVEQWKPVLLPVCLWTPKVETLPTTGGFKKNNLASVFIDWKNRPSDKEYIGVNAYAALSEAERENYWTLNPLKDRILKGTTTETDSKVIFKLDNCFTVQSAQFYEYGLKHWEVDAK